MSSQQAEISAADRADAATIWDFHQMHHQRRPCEAAIGLGSHDLGVAAFAAKLYHAGMLPVVVFSGANSPTTVPPAPHRIPGAGLRRRPRRPPPVDAAYQRLLQGGYDTRLLGR